MRAGIAVDASGAAYVTGVTRYVDFPTTPGAYDTSWDGGAGARRAMFVAKLNPAGDRFSYLTFLGGSGNDEGLALRSMRWAGVCHRLHRVG
jgi:hypothetical protein